MPAGFTSPVISGMTRSYGVIANDSCRSPIALLPGRDGPRSLQLLRRQTGSFRERGELGPRDLGVRDAAADAAVGPGHDALGSDRPRITHEALRDQLGVLDEVGDVPDH